MWVDPLDQTHVFAAGVYLCESKNSGSSFTGEFSPHADDHAMAWDLKVPGRVYLGNDGGTLSIGRQRLERPVDGCGQPAVYCSSTAWT